MNMQQEEQQTSSYRMPPPWRPISIISLLSPLSPTRFTNPSLPRASFAFSPHCAFDYNNSLRQPTPPPVDIATFGVPRPPRPHIAGFHGVSVNESYMASIKRTFEQIFTADDEERGKEKRIRQHGGEAPGKGSGVENGGTSTGSGMDRSSDNARAKANEPLIFKDPSFFKRKWKFRVPRGGQLKPGEFQFTLLSYNILAQGLLMNNPHLYKQVNPLYLDWNYRRANLLQEMISLNADIICLQEVERAHFHDFFQPLFSKRGYAAIYKQRTGDKTDGCAIFFKASCFELVKSKSVSYYRRNIPLLDRDNVGIVALLKTTKGPTQHLCVATTHLLFNPRRGDIKLAQISLLLAEIDQLSHYKTRNGHCIQCPVILCGDLNSLPQSPLSRLIGKGSVDFKDIPAGDISGQTEGRRGGLRFLSRPPIPVALRITRDCQYISALEDRRMEEERHRGKSQGQKQSSDDTGWEEVRSNGRDTNTTVGHPLSFSSVYSLEESSREVTTNHSRTNCMVDYIFYSTSDASACDKRKSKMEGNLQLVGSLQLFKDEEATAMGGLPNKLWSSDHFALMASFILR